MQRDTTAQIGEQYDIETISLRYFDCLLFERGEVFKMFMPETRRAIGGTPRDRVISGSLIFAFEVDFVPLRAPSKRFDLVNEIVRVHTMNFPTLVSLSTLRGDRVDQLFLAGVIALVSALPKDRIGWCSLFGDELLSVAQNQRAFEVVQFLRGIDLGNFHRG